MSRILCAALALASSVVLASQAHATPVFQMKITSGSYNSGIIAGTIDPGHLSGSVSVSALTVAGGGGASFTIGSIKGTFDLSPVIDMRLIGSGITHTSNAGGVIRIALALGGLDDPHTALSFLDDFSGTLASTGTLTNSEATVYVAKKPFGKNDLLFDLGPVTSQAAGPDCILPTSLSYSCSGLNDVASVPHNPYALNEVITLKFARNTLNLSEDFNNKVAQPVPEPNSLALLATAMFAVAGGFGLRRRPDRQSAV